MPSKKNKYPLHRSVANLPRKVQILIIETAIRYFTSQHAYSDDVAAYIAIRDSNIRKEFDSLQSIHIDLWQPFEHYTMGDIEELLDGYIETVVELVVVSSKEIRKAGRNVLRI